MVMVLIAALVSQASAQSPDYKNVQLSEPHPEQGQDISVTYSPAWGSASASREITAVVSFYKSARYARTESFKAQLVKGNYVYQLHLSDSVKVFALTFKMDTSADNNQGKGYLVDVYKNKKPVRDVLGIRSFIYTYGDEPAGVKPDQALGLTLVNQQLQQYPDSKGEFDVIRYLCMAHSKEESVRNQLQAELQELLKSNDEEEWQKAINGYVFMKMNQTVDSVSKLRVLRFPNGILARGTGAQQIYQLTKAAAMEQAYFNWMKRFPPENFKDNGLQYDYIRVAVARSFAQIKDSVKSLAYANLVKVDFYKSNAYNQVADELFRQGLFETAKQLYKKAIEIADVYMNEKKEDDHAMQAASAFLASCTNYAIILYQQKQYPEALSYISRAYALHKKSNDLNYYYAEILVANHRIEEAYTVLDEAVRNGKANQQITDKFRELYRNVKGSDNGLDTYLAGIKKELAVQAREELNRHMLNKPAPLFSLTDLDGHTVSLAALKGKVVVLDFWATWCGPCKKSFPAMQAALNKYQKDTDVTFLFIHTWENSEEPAKEAQAYIRDQKYNFQVLMDLKDPVLKKNAVVDSYGVTGIPAKFVIDKNGKIRYQLTGFNGDTADAVEELSYMIELAKTVSVTAAHPVIN